MNNNVLRVDPNKLIFLLTLLCCSQPRSDLFSEASNVDRWKCFSCWCRTLRKMNIYTEAHLGVLQYAAESQKCNQLILLHSCVSPNIPSINSPLKTQTHQFLPPPCVRHSSCSCIASKEAAQIHYFLKKIFWRGQKAQSMHACVWVTESPCDQWKFTACRLSSDKSAGQNEREIGVLTEATKRAPSRATNCFPPLHYTALTWLKPYINYQPPQWNISSTAVPFLVYFKMSAEQTSHHRSQAGNTESLMRRQVYYKSAARPKELSSCWQVLVASQVVREKTVKGV